LEEAIIMSTATGPKAPADSTALDEEPIDYGFRYVTRTLPDGRQDIEWVPLTEEDVLHPREGDAIMQGDPHEVDRDYLTDVFKHATVKDPMARVFSDLGVNLGLPRVRPVSPDITVVFGVPDDRIWTMYKVAEFGIRPWLIIEITSRATRNNDLTRKVVYYLRAEVPMYLIADGPVRRGERKLQLLGYRDTPDGYVDWLPDDRGWFWLDRLGLWLGVARGRIVCYDPQGKEIADYVALSQALAVTEARAKKSAKARKAAEARAKEEAQARAMAEDRLRELEEKIRRLEQTGEKNRP